MDFKNPAKTLIFTRKIDLAGIQSFWPGPYVLFLHVSRLYPFKEHYKYKPSMIRFGASQDVKPAHRRLTMERSIRFGIISPGTPTCFPTCCQ